MLKTVLGTEVLAEKRYRYDENGNRIGRILDGGRSGIFTINGTG
jgi:hypothetical protein